MINKFSALVNDTGFLNDEAKQFVNERFVKEVKTLLNFANSESELRIIGSILNSIIGNAVAARVQDAKK